MNKTRVRYKRVDNTLVSGSFLANDVIVTGLIDTTANSLTVTVGGETKVINSFDTLTQAKNAFKTVLKELGVKFMGETRLHDKTNVDFTAG